MTGSTQVLACRSIAPSAPPHSCRAACSGVTRARQQRFEALPGRLSGRNPRRERRRSASPRATRAWADGDSGGAAAAISSISRGTPLQCRARSQPASSARRARSPSSRRAPHREIVGDEHAAEADFAADDGLDHARATRSPARLRRSPCRRYARSSPTACRQARGTARNRVRDSSSRPASTRGRA